MGTSTAKFGLFKPAGSDSINEVTDLNNNWDAIDNNSLPLLDDYKLSDTSRFNTTTQTADPELSIATVAGKNYFLEGALLVDSGSETADFAFSLHHTGTATGSWGAMGLATGTSAGIGNVLTDGFDDISIANTAIRARGIGAATATLIIIQGLIRVTASGSLQLHWAQNVANATPTTLKKDSYLKLFKLN